MVRAISSILVWKYDEAPDKYRDLGDFDKSYNWVAVIPSSMQEEEAPRWVHGFSSEEIEEHWLRSGVRVILG
jgi:hypothetical protein